MNRARGLVQVAAQIALVGLARSSIGVHAMVGLMVFGPFWTESFLKLFPV